MHKILDLSEGWVVLIPLSIFFIKKPGEPYLRVVFIYLLLAFFLNVTADFIEENYYHEPQWIINLNYNQPLYNLHSIIRLFIFIYFFRLIKIPAGHVLKIIIPLVALFIIIINFFFYNSFKIFSSVIFAVEGIVLIILCISFFLHRLKSDVISSNFDASLYVVTGLAIYEAICFPIFLFYQTLSKQTENFAVGIWDVHNIAYIVFCLFMAKAFYGNSRYTTE